MPEPMFWWTESHRALQQEAEAFADSMRDYSREIMWTREYPWTSMREIADRGWLGAVIPAAYGGRAEELGGVTSLAILSEALGRIWPASWPFTLTAFGGTKQIVDAGTEEQKRRWLPRIAAGDSLGALCITEPFTGSDASNVETRATRTPDGYVISGKKRFISNIGAAGHYLVYAVTDAGDADARKQRRHLSVFFVDRDTPGLSVERYHELGGYSYLRNGILDLDEVTVPASHRIGEEGDGWKIMTSGLNLERVLVAAGSVGNMREALRYGASYTRRRIQFGQPVADFAAVQAKLSEAIVNVRVDRAFVHQTAARADRGEDTALDAAVGKLATSRHAVATCLDMVQAMGGDGATRYYPVEQLARDMTIKGIGGGTNEVMTGLIYRMAGKSIPDDLWFDVQGYFPAALRTAPARSPEGQDPEEQILGVLAEQYVQNPGLFVEIGTVASVLDVAVETLEAALASLQESGDAVLWPTGERAAKLVRPTYDGLRRAHPADWYRLDPPDWVGPRERLAEPDSASERLVDAR